MNQYRVRYQLFGSSTVRTDTGETPGCLITARIRRDEIFQSRAISRCWVDRNGEVFGGVRERIAEAQRLGLLAQIFGLRIAG